MPVSSDRIPMPQPSLSGQSGPYPPQSRVASSPHTMEGPAAPVLGSLEQGPPPGSDVIVLTIPAPVRVGKAIYPQVVNWAQGKHPTKVASVGQPGEAERVGNTKNFR